MDAFELMREYGVEAANLSLKAEQFGLEQEAVAEDLANGLTEGQALLGRAMQQGNDFWLESSEEYYELVAGLDGDPSDLNAAQDPELELLEGAMDPESNVDLVGFGDDLMFEFG